MLNTIPDDTLMKTFITFTKLWRDNSCVSIAPGIVQNLNMATEKLVMETPNPRKTLKYGSKVLTLSVRTCLHDEVKQVFSEVCLLDAAVPQAEVGF